MSQFDLNAFLAGTDTQPSPTPSTLANTPQQFDLNTFLGNTNTSEADAQPVQMQPQTETIVSNSSIPSLSDLEKRTANEQAKAYADQFNQQITQHKTDNLAKIEADDNNSAWLKYDARKRYDDLMAVPEYKAFLKYQGQLRQHLDNNPQYSEQQKAYLLEEFDKMANPYHRADTWGNTGSDLIVSAVESIPRLGERLANNFGARSWAANLLRSGADKVHSELSAKNRIEAYETEAAVQAAEQQDGQLAAAKKAAEMAEKYPNYVANMGARELTAQLGLGALTGGKSLAFTGSAMETGALLGEWANQVEQLPQADLEKLKPYQRRIQEGMTPAEARADLANTNFFEDDGLKPYLIAAGALGSLDRYLSIGKGVSPLVKQSAGKTLIKSILSDMTREALQEGAAQMNQNIALSEINPQQKLLQGVGSATFYGGALGTMSGTVGGTVQAAQHNQAEKQQKTVDDLIGATKAEETETKAETEVEQANPYQKDVLNAELAKIEDEEQRKAFEDAFIADADLGLLEKRLKEKTSYGDFVRNVLAEEQAEQVEPTVESETQPQPSSLLTEEQRPRFQQYVQGLSQAYRTNDNTALKQVLSEFSPEEQTLFAQEVARIFIEARPDVKTAIDQGKSLQELNDMIANPPQAVETPQNVANQNDPTLDAETKAEQALYSHSPMKSVEANIKRGQERMTQAILDKADVKRGMYNQEFGWVDFVWGDDGTTKGVNRFGEPRGRGLAHIYEARMRKDGLTEQQVTQMLTNDIVETIAKGTPKQSNRAGNERLELNYLNPNNGQTHRAILTRNKGSNSWLLTGFEVGGGATRPGSATSSPTHINRTHSRDDVVAPMYPNDPNKGRKANSNGERTVGYGTSTPTQTTPMRSRDNLGALEMHQQAGYGLNVHQSTPQSNPQIAKDQQTLSRILGEETARHIRIIDSNTQIPTGEDVLELKTNGVEGWYNKRTQEIYIISDSITANRVMGRDERLAWVAWHELAHFGVNVRFKDRLDMLLKEASRHSAVSGLASRIQGANKGMSREVALEEAIVELHAAQKTGNWAEIENRYGVIPESLKGSTLQQHLAKLARWLRQLLRFVTRKDPNPESDDALFEILKTVDNSVKSAVKNPQNQTASENGDIRYSLSEEPNSEFAKAIDNVVNGDIPKGRISMGTTPAVLKMLGVPDTEIRITGGIIQKVMGEHLGIEKGNYSHIHNLTPEALKQLPKQMNNPVAVFKSSTRNNAYVVLTELNETDSKTGKQKPVVSALHINIGKGDVEVIDVRSVYGRGDNQLSTAFRDDLLYFNKTKGQQFLKTHPLQLHWDLTSDANLSARNIKTEADLSQYQSENSDNIRFSRSANYRFKKSDLEFNQDRLIGKSSFSIYKNDTLANLFNHSPLFEHFPELANTKVVEDPSLYERIVRYDEQNDSLLVGNFTHPSTFKSAVENLAKEKIKSAPKVKANKQPSAVDDEYMELAKRYENGDHSVEPRLRELVDNQAKANGFDADISFRMDHSAPNAHDGYSVTGDNLAEMVGDDIYSSEAEMYFGTGDERADRESINQIRRMKNRPNAEVTIYRAIPKSFKGTAIGDGDWVSLSRTYTEQHGENALDGDYKIAMKKVKANELYWNGDSINEFGYDSGNNNYRSSEVNRNKSSELITRTDSGRIIPLSKRFNPDKTDIRYSRRERHSLEDDVANKQVNPTKENGWSFKGLKSKVIETILDDTQPVKDYIDELPLPKQWQKTIKNALDLTPTKRRALTDEYEQRYIKPLLKNIAQLANKHNKDILTTKRFVEYWASLNWSIQKNPELLAEDEQAFNEAEKDLQDAIAQGDQDVIDKAQFAYNKAERQYQYRKADVETTKWRTHTPKVGTAGGWSIPQAEFIKGEIEKIFPVDEIQTALKPLYEMLQHKLDVDLAAGRISQQEYQERKSKPDYVPLTGNPNEDPEMDFIASSSDKTINTSTDKRMKGRKTSISEGAIDATWREIAKSSTIAAFADFKQELFMVYDALVQEQINQGKSQKEAEKFVEEEYQLSRKRKSGTTRPSDNVLIHKHQGQYYEIGIPTKAIDALKHKWTEDVNGLLEWIKTPTSWAARGYTQWRVDFALKNMIRDMGERGFFITSREMYKPNGQQVGVMERHIMGAKILSNAFNPAVWTASARYAAKGIQGLRDNVPVEAHFKSLIQEGGVSTIGTYLASSEKDLIKQIEAENAPLAKSLSLAGKAIEGWNKIFDMISSISTAHVLRNHGLDAKMTAATTLNLSNFTHTGKIMRPFKALYAFSQPTAMGGRNLLSHLSTKTGAIQFAALTAAGMVLYSFLRAMDDEDERGNKMDMAGDLSREILVPTGNGKYIKIPVPFGMSQMAWNVATNTVRAMEKSIKPEDAVANITSQFLKSNIAFISPSDIPASTDPWAKAVITITPTFFKPFAEIGENRSAFGGIIYQENRGNKLDIETAKPTTNQLWRDFAEAVYDLTGIDWTPEAYQHTANGYLRMLGTMGEVAVNAIENPNRELLGRPTVTPVVNGFYGPKGENAIQSLYYEYVAEAEQVHLEYEYLKANGKLTPEWRTEERRNLLYLYNMNKSKMKNLDKEYKEILAYRKKPRFSDEMYKRRLATYYRKAEAVQKEIVHRYRKNNGLHTVRP